MIVPECVLYDKSKKSCNYKEIKFICHLIDCKFMRVTSLLICNCQIKLRFSWQSLHQIKIPMKNLSELKIPFKQELQCQHYNFTYIFNSHLSSL